MKFRKKPVVIDAIEFTGTNENLVELSEFLNDTLIYNPRKNELTIRTLEGDMIARKGWWIVKGIRGEFYPVEGSIFLDTYEPVIDYGN